MMGEQGLALFYELRKLLNPNKHSLNYKRFIDSLWKIRSRVHRYIMNTFCIYTAYIIHECIKSRHFIYITHINQPSHVLVSSFYLFFR